MALRRVVNMTVDDSCKSLYSQVYLEGTFSKSSTLITLFSLVCITDITKSVFLQYFVTSPCNG